jgi:hypothetical protein
MSFTDHLSAAVKALGTVVPQTISEHIPEIAGLTLMNYLQFYLASSMPSAVAKSAMAAMWWGSVETAVADVAKAGYLSPLGSLGVVAY